MCKTLAVVIPTYNERNNIEPLIQRIHASLSGNDYETIFIDDDSTDGTADAIRNLEKDFPVRVIVRKDKKGLASAVVEGIAKAAAEISGVMDADLQHPPEVLRDLLKAVEGGADIAVASRYVKDGGGIGWGLTRRLISTGAVLIAHLFLPETRTVHDPMSGCFMFRRDVVKGVDLTPTGYKILLEILVKGHYGKLVEVPYQFCSRREGKSKLSAKQQLYYLQHVYCLMKRRQELLRFAAFCLVGGSGVLVNTGFLWALTEFGGVFFLISSTIAIECAVISNFILNDVFTFSDRLSRRGKSFLRRLLKFNMVSLIGAGVNLSLLWFFTSVVGLHYLVSNLIGIAAATLWNYLANVLWTWR